MIEFLEGFQDDIIAVAAHGEVTEEDYRKALVPIVEEKLWRYHDVRLFIHLGPTFNGFTAGAMWQDTKLGVSHWSRWGRVAVVTDVGWITQAVRLFAPLFRHAVRVFPNAEYDVARGWILQPEPMRHAA
jgi:hypothetical protein